MKNLNLAIIFQIAVLLGAFSAPAMANESGDSRRESDQYVVIKTFKPKSGGRLATQITSYNKDFSSESLAKELPEQAHNVAADIGSDVRDFVDSHQDFLQIKCLKVKAASPHYFLDANDRHYSGYTFYYLNAYRSLECLPRNLGDEALVSFAVNCSKAPTEACLGKLSDPGFAARINSIQRTEFNIN